MTPVDPLEISTQVESIPPLAAFAKPKSSPFRELDIARMLAQEAPDVEWLIPDFIPLGVPGSMVGRPGSGKSMLVMQLCVSLALGVPFLGKQGPPQASGVLYLCMEDDGKEVHRRLRRTTKKAGIRGQGDKEKLVAQNVRILSPDLRLGISDLALLSNVELVLDYTRKFEGGCSLIVLDTQSAMFDGDENSVRDSTEFWGACHALSQETCATVLVLHHTRKSNDKADSKSLTERLNPENSRGSGAGEGRARFMLAVATLFPHEAASLDLPIEGSHREGYLVLASSKLNSGPKGHWLFLERGANDSDFPGLLSPHPESAALITKLRGSDSSGSSGGRRKGGITLKEKVLMAISFAGSLEKVDKDAVITTLWPGVPTAPQQWKRQLEALSKVGWMKEDQITTKGLKALGMEGKSASPTG